MFGRSESSLDKAVKVASDHPALCIVALIILAFGGKHLSLQ